MLTLGNFLGKLFMEASKVYLRWSQIENGISILVNQMYEDNWYPDYIIGITRGGCIPAIIMSEQLNIPMFPLSVQLHDLKCTVSDTGMAADAYSGLRLLILDDINNTGSTINWIKNDWRSCHCPDDPLWDTVFGNTVKFGVIHDNVTSTERVDYFVYQINKELNELCYVYPWESQSDV